MQPISNWHRTVFNTRRHGRAPLILMIVVSILGVNTFSGVAHANPLAATAGTISVRGSVKVNGRAATDGQTLFAKSTIQTAENSDSVIVLANRAQLHLAATGELSVNSSDQNLIGTLATGRVFVSVPAGVSLEFSTADLSITKQSVSESVLFALRATECDGTKLDVINGRVAVRHHSHSQVVESGQPFSTAPAATPQTSQNSFSNKKKLGIIFGIAGAAAILLAVALGKNDEQQNLNFGGCVIVPSGNGSSPCPELKSFGS